MSIKIPRIIDEQEILVRFIFEKHFKKKKIEINRVNDGEIFLDIRGVSLQRESYCDENKCKELAKSNSKQKYIGFVIFKLTDFNLVVRTHKIDRLEFNAKIIATPLDEKLNVVPEEIELTTKTLGLPAHADMIITPALIDDESPKIAIRKFSRKLFKKSILIIDDKSEEKIFSKCVFSNVI